MMPPMTIMVASKRLRRRGRVGVVKGGRITRRGKEAKK
jgi:hypothetical protein